ncbi:MAG: hypothetical protein ACI8YQ_003887 [Polaribacter sp.]|jgi:hypothetical protein
MEEPEEGLLLPPNRRRLIWFYLEWIPISLLSIGILLRRQGSELWPYFLVGGGIATGVIFLLFSTILLNPQKGSRLEMVLSIVSGLLVAMGVGALIAKFLYWEIAPQLILTSIYAGLGMIFLVAIVFLLKIRKPESVRFYRGLLARLFIFVALVYSLGV